MNKGGFWKNLFEKGAVLDPIDRISEVLFGLIMTLTLTGAISVSTATSDDVHQLLWAAMGCNFAWGLVDGAMNLMSSLLERGHNLAVIRKIKNSESEKDLMHVLSDEIPPLLAELITPQEMQTLGQRIKSLPDPPAKRLLNRQDIVSFVQIFILVFFCTMPIALPFALVNDLYLAMRISNGLALVMLFSGGYILAGYSGFKRLPTAINFTVLGLLLVAITIAVGG